MRAAGSGRGTRIGVGLAAILLLVLAAASVLRESRQPAEDPTGHVAAAANSALGTRPRAARPAGPGDEPPALAAQEIGGPACIDVTGLVIDEAGRRAPGVTVAVTLDGCHARPCGQGLTGPDGEFRIAAALDTAAQVAAQSAAQGLGPVFADDADTIRFSVRAMTARGAVSAPVAVAVRRGVAPAPVLLIVRTARIVQGRVTDAAAHAVAGAEIVAWCFPRRRHPWEADGSDGVSWTEHADASGEFRLAAPAGELWLFARRPSVDAIFGPSVRLPDVAPGTIEECALRVVDESVEFALDVRDESGVPIEDALVRVEPEESIHAATLGGASSLVHARTDADGRAIVRVRVSDRPFIAAVGRHGYRPLEVVASRVVPGVRTLPVVLRRKFRISCAVSLSSGERAPIPLDWQIGITRMSGGRPPQFERLAFDGAAPPSDLGYDEPLVRVMDWITDDPRPIRSPDRNSAEDEAWVRVPGDYEVSVWSGPVAPERRSVRVDDEHPFALVTVELPAGRRVSVTGRGEPEDATGWRVWGTYPGELADDWPRSPQELGASLVCGRELVTGTRTDSPQSQSWWLPWKYSMLAARNIRPLQRRSPASGPVFRVALQRVPIPPGDMPAVIVDVAKPPVSGESTPVRARLLVQGRPVQASGWVIEARAREGGRIATADTDSRGEATLRLHPGQYEIDIAEQHGPRRSVAIDLTSRPEGGVHSVDIELAGRNW